MASKRKSGKKGPRNRITVEAQGGGTQKSVRWHKPQQRPTVADVQGMLTQLEAKLTATEKQLRQQAFADARAYIVKLASAGYSVPPSPKLQASFPQPPLKNGVRVDVNVFSGKILP